MGQATKIGETGVLRLTDDCSMVAAPWLPTVSTAMVSPIPVEDLTASGGNSACMTGKDHTR